MITHDACRHCGKCCALERRNVDAKLRHDRGLFVLDVRQLRRGGRRAIREQLFGQDDAPTLARLRGVFRGELAEVHRLGHVDARHARELDGGAAEVRGRVERGDVAIVIDAVPRNLERAGIDFAGACATGAEGIAAVATTGAPAVAIEIGVVVNDAVAVIVEVVSARLVMRQELADACAPAGAVGFACLRSAFANADAVGAWSALITRLLLSRHTAAGSVLQNVPFASVLRILITVGETHLAGTERADAVVAERAAIIGECTSILAEAAVVLVVGKVVTTTGAAAETRLAWLKARTARNTRVGQTDRPCAAIGIDQTSHAFVADFVAGLSWVAVENARAADFTLMRERLAIGALRAVVCRRFRGQTLHTFRGLDVAHGACRIHGAIGILFAAHGPSTHAARTSHSANGHPSSTTSTTHVAATRTRRRRGCSGGLGVYFLRATSRKRCADGESGYDQDRARHAHARETCRCLHRMPHKKLRERTNCTTRCKRERDAAIVKSRRVSFTGESRLPWVASPNGSNRATRSNRRCDHRRRR